MRRIPFAAAALLIAMILVPALASAQAVHLTDEQAAFDAGSFNAFAKENVGSFTTATLSNGIPVVIKRSTTNRILTLKAMLTGHVAWTPLDKAGLEAVMLTMLTRGSEHYTYADVQRLAFETSGNIVPRYQSYDLTSLDLVTIDTYFDRLFPAFVDALRHPAWNADEFPRVISDFKLQKQQSATDPFSAAVTDLDQRFFQGHPYAASWQGEGDSLDHITIDDLKSYYGEAMTAGRLFLVAVGNFDPATLVPQLEQAFGTLPAGSSPRPAVPSFKGSVQTDLMVVPFPRSEGLAYVRGDFAMPDPSSPDYAPSLLAFDLLNDILFEIVRTRNGAAYGAEASVEGGTAAYGDITVYRTSAPGKVKKLVDEAISVLTSGRSLSGKINASAAGKGGLGSPAEAAASAFVPVADALPFYKLKFITEFYSGQETNRQTASQIAGSLYYHGDYRHYLLLIDRINAVTADDVVRVARTWLVNNPTLWIALGDAALLKDVKREDYVSAASP
ncbi:MAG TPA: pitrilysin family protein [Spirochaetia bacterium]|nr:pitrilysin family protein [Spirochaetia bacterium]